MRIPQKSANFEIFMKKTFLSALFLLVFLAGCGAPPRESAESSSVYLTSMDTVMTLTAYGSHRTEALSKAQSEIEYLDSILSTGKPDSEISRLNEKGTLRLSDDAFPLFDRAMTLSRDTDGLFDPTVYPLVKLWGFYDKNYHVPTDEERTQAMALIGSSRVEYDPNTRSVTLAPGQSIDLGAIGKGYASQRAAEIMKAAGVTSAILSLGGNVQCLGSKPNGSPWNIGIRDPWSESGSLYCTVQVRDKAVITSGGYERFFVMDGKTYLHILDPRTGFPAESGLSSVSIITSDGTLGDGLSTTLYIMGLEKATDYWRRNSEAFDAVFIADDGTLYATSGLKGSIQSQHPIVFIDP